MELEIHGGPSMEDMPSDDRVLIERLGETIAGLHFTRTSGGTEYIVGAIVFPDRPMRLCFFVCIATDKEARANTGPQVNFTKRVFAGGNLSPRLLDRIQKAFEDFIEDRQVNR